MIRGFFFLFLFGLPLFFPDLASVLQINAQKCVIAGDRDPPSTDILQLIGQHMWLLHKSSRVAHPAMPVIIAVHFLLSAKTNADIHSLLMLTLGKSLELQKSLNKVGKNSPPTLSTRQSTVTGGERNPPWQDVGDSHLLSCPRKRSKQQPGKFSSPGAAGSVWA